MSHLRLVTRDAEDGDDHIETKAPSYSPSPARHRVRVEPAGGEPAPEPPAPSRLTRAQLAHWATSPVTANGSQLRRIAAGRATWKAILTGGVLLALYALYGYLAT